MALPKIKQPTYIFDTSDGKQLEFRPYTIGEEKIIMTIKESKDAKLIASNIKKVIQNCILTPDFNVNNLPTYDIELLLLKIRSKSHGEIIEIKYQDPETGESFPAEIDLEEAYIKRHEGRKHKIEIADGSIILIMQDLSFEQVLEYQLVEDRTEIAFKAVVDSVKAIHDVGEDKTYTVGEDTTREEAEEFINQLSGETKKLFEFVETSPKVSCDIKLPNGKTQTLQDINSFLG